VGGRTMSGRPPRRLVRDVVGSAGWYYAPKPRRWRL
jgi:hypothetical protein